MRIERVRPGTRLPAGVVGSILTRDIVVDGVRWSKGRPLDADDLGRLERARAVSPSGELTVLVPQSGDLHEDEAAVRLAAVVGGAGLVAHGPVESRVDLRAESDGVLRVRTAALERLNRIDPIEAFTAYDGRIVSAGDLVASVKVAPHLVPEAVVAAAERVAARSGPIVAVEPFRAHRVGVLVQERVGRPARARFERTIRAKIEGLGSTVEAIVYCDRPEDVAPALRRLTRGREASDLILTAGAGSTDPLDPIFLALRELGGRMVRQGVPSHPGSMLWLARLGRVPVLGMPSCGAYSKATAVDLLLPRLLAGEPPTRATIARLGHGGILTRDQRYRFPAYARELEAPEG